MPRNMPILPVRLWNSVYIREVYQEVRVKREDEGIDEKLCSTCPYWTETKQKTVFHKPPVTIYRVMVVRNDKSFRRVRNG